MLPGPHAREGADLQAPLTLGTAGHVDHGKTTLVKTLTGVDTDRLPEERERGISIALGYAPLTTPSGRSLSVVDVPGHERFIRTMVSGATGIDFYLMTVAADDGVMPQTREHAEILRVLGVRAGVVAITKADLLDPELARADVADLLPGVPAIAVSARTGAGIDDLLRAIDAVGATVHPRAELDARPALLHVDRVFTIRGAGTVVTGTLRAGSIGHGDVLVLLPRNEPVRVRGVEVHDRSVERAGAGQRVAVNLTGVRVGDVARGDVLVGAGSEVTPAVVADVELEVDLHGARVQVHHGTRETPAKVRRLAGAVHRLRLERPLMLAKGDRVVIRAVSPPQTLGGGPVVAAYAGHGDVVARRRPGQTAREQAPARPAPAVADAAQQPAEPSPGALEVEERLRAAGHEPPGNGELDDAGLAEARAAGRVVRVGRTLHFHREVLDDLERRVREIVEAEGQITLGRLRDELQTSRKFAQAILEHFDSRRVTLRRDDDSRVLGRRSQRS